MIKFLIFIFLLLSCTSNSSAIIPVEWTLATHSYLQIQESKVPYVRIKNENAQPILFIHGFTGNAHNWMNLASKLSQRNLYDIWAISWASQQSLSIDTLSSETIAKVIDKIKEKTNQKPIIIGHSLGALATKIYLLNQKFKQSVNIKALISIASPNGFQAYSNLGRAIEIFPSIHSPLQKNLSKLIRENKLNKDISTIRYIETSLFPLSLWPFSEIFTMLFNSQNQDSIREVSLYLRYGYEKVPPLVLTQMEDWFKAKTFRSFDKRLNYTEKLFSYYTSVPQAFISGSEDLIAPAGSIWREALFHKAPYLELKDSGHFDPLISKGSNKTLRFILNFLQTIP